MYENNQHGFHLYGALEDLQMAIKSGGLVRVYLPGIDSASDAHRIHITGNGHVCAELPKRIRYWKSNNESAESDAYWSLAMTCTSGYFEELRKNVGTGRSEATGISFADTRWYVKYHSMSNMALHGHDKLHGHDRLRMSVANGFPVHGVTTGRDRTDVIPLHTVTDACSDCVFAQAIDAVELRNCSGSRCEFEQPYSFWLSQQMTPAGHIRTTRTKMDVFSGTSTLDSDEKFDWFADTCWRLVYSHGNSGHRIEGSHSDLLVAIGSGHRVRVQVQLQDVITAEADVIRVRNNHVTTLLLRLVTDDGTEAPTTVNITSDDQTYRTWLMVSTTGEVRIRRIRMDCGLPARHVDEVVSSDVHWFVDTRPWMRVLSVNAIGNATDATGNATDASELASVVRKGAAVRHLVTGSDDDTELLSARYLHVLGDVVVAENSLGVCTLPVTDGGFAFCQNPSWRFTSVTSEGDYAEDDWACCGHQRLGSMSTRRAVDWFVSY